MKIIKQFFNSLLSQVDSVTMAHSPKKQYTVIVHRESNALEDAVNSAMSDGWIPCGGVSHMRLKIGGNQYDHVEREYWSQAMIKNIF